jgi:hypothetical protein
MRLNTDNEFRTAVLARLTLLNSNAASPVADVISSTVAMSPEAAAESRALARICPMHGDEATIIQTEPGQDPDTVATWQCSIKPGIAWIGIPYDSETMDINMTVRVGDRDLHLREWWLQ